MAVIQVAYDAQGRIVEITRRERNKKEDTILGYTLQALIRRPSSVSPIQVIAPQVGTVHELQQKIRDADYLTEQQKISFRALARGFEPFDRVEVVELSPLALKLFSEAARARDAGQPTARVGIITYYVDP